MSGNYDSSPSSSDRARARPRPRVDRRRPARTVMTDLAAPDRACPICAGRAFAHDVVDFNKSCVEGSGTYLRLSGVPIYYYLCEGCGFCYAPEIYGFSRHALFGPQPQWWPSRIPFSPALFILPIPFLFRFTCYFFRGAYYKAVWADPPACAVSEPRKGYTGENGLPLILQNLHTYALYLAILLLCFVWYDAVKAFNFDRG